ncbi:MAG: hypothetical protein A3C06_02360 [Candidatus Taylorbacteria bacterium RIFCSPHIGHO2_02_FULL_46_13]|uniref:Uncharacterized protein n=1 Tax=Candidatus Taylorbacteria bacterium RIFCSPHIGHO2_02_FULL_46_13 TaxID=1802312 RepID=A0A1G2MSN6_9BACT|nr:MAG: hypothetical protein A3C06_02360 [Candidatus Taylorbacteria bacterium RIFCSPHIGHO2_02_FULL_46_13]
MFKFFDRLRGEPESYRRRTALVVSFSLTGVVLIAWLMSLSVSSRYSYNQAQATSSTSPTAAVREAFVGGVSIVKDFMNAIQQTKSIIFNAASSSPASSTEIQ